MLQPLQPSQFPSAIRCPSDSCATLYVGTPTTTSRRHTCEEIAKTVEKLVVFLAIKSPNNDDLIQI
ncbi:hypothetical protein ES319_A05G053000v1 [Gossypium barbadense]|uniref:Uncharacterized protein n=2 Tax=Gossypium TaxID=3633 RepID=A0A5J5VJT1_GOSBA|nr:hypothetical protein ES319_A05G053000v1 [Gossypium barbadense]TYH15603.1 hypothetical protein ES288_A05G054700v1 [Gossypium darwinii]